MARCLLNPACALWSKIAFLAGFSYLFIPVDFIPDRIPYFGHLDEAGFVLAGLLAARLLAPVSFHVLADAPRIETRTAHARAQQLRFAVRVLRADLANFFLFQYRGVNAFLITGKNSGTHWLKFMLSCAIAAEFQVPAPVHASGRTANAIIGHPSGPVTYPDLPRIGSSHTIPSVAFAWPLRLFDHPPVVVLVRDIREAMLSNYVKWQQDYPGSFADYVSGDPLGRRHVADVWWYIHFFNRWGDVASARPHNTLIVHYEDLKAAPDYWLRHIARHLAVSLSDLALDAALQFVDRGAVRDRLDPSFGETIIPSPSARQSVAFSAADEAMLQDILRRNLRHNLGYDYPVRSTSRRFQAPERGQCQVSKV